MATSKIDIAFNKFQGIKQRNAVVDYSSGTISAIQCLNCELYPTQMGDNIGVRTISGRLHVDLALADGYVIVGDFTTKQDDEEFRILYCEDDTKGTLYLVEGNILTVIVDNLIKTGACNGIDIVQGYYDYFVFTNGEEIYAWCNAKTPQYEQINAVDADGRDVKGLALGSTNQRLVIGCDNRVHWSKQTDMFDFASTETGTVTGAAYQEFTNRITAIATYIEGIIAFTEKDSTFMSGNPADVENFIRQDASLGGTPSYSSIVVHDKYLFYYDQRQHNIYYFLQNDVGQKRTGEAIAFEIQDYLVDLDNTRVKEIKMFSVYASGKNEIWVFLPLVNGGQRFLIYDYYTSQWLERSTDGINTVNIIDNEIYTSEGKDIYKENVGSFFGESAYKLAIINLGSDTNLKIPKLLPTVSLDTDKDNEFWVEIRVDGKAKSKQKLITLHNLDGYFEFADDDVTDEEAPDYMRWDLATFPPENDNIALVAKLPPIPAFKQLELKFYTQGGQNFAIKRFELKRVRQKTKTL